MALTRSISGIDDLVPNAAPGHALARGPTGYLSVADRYNVRAYGAKGDGTDDTAALQAAITAAASAPATVALPPGNFRITTRLDVPRRPGWAIVGAGRKLTTITQAADNTPILFLGSDDASAMHSYRIEGIGFTYATSQPATNTDAVPIAFAKEGYEGALRDLAFSRGSYGIRVVAAVPAPWGQDWDELVFEGGLTKGAIDTATLGTLGVPNNRWGRFLIDAQNMVGPTISAKGYNWTIDTIEWIQANQGAKLLSLASGSEVTIGAIKLENGVYAVSTTLFEFLANSVADIGQVAVSGSTMTVNGGVKLTVVVPGSGGNTRARIGVGVMRLDGTGVAGTIYGFGGSPAHGSRCRQFVPLITNATLADNAASAAPDALWVDTFTNHRVSADKGDANYTVAVGDPNVVMFETAFTAPRTITLPSDGNTLHNGLYYAIVIGAGVVNGANTLLVKSGAVTLHTETSPKRVIRFTWRRHATATSGWKMTGYESLP